MRRFTLLLHLLLVTGACLSLAVFLVGRTLTDRFLLTQYLYWIPSVALVASAAVFSLPAWAVGRLRRRWLGAAGPGGRRPRSVADLVTRVALVGTAATVLFVLLVEWRIWAALAPSPSAGTPTLHFAHWNMTFVPHEEWPRFIAGVPRDPEPDVLLITNPTWSSDLGRLAEALGSGYTCKRVGTFAVASRLPILQTGWASLELPQVDEQTARLTAPFYSPRGGDNEYLPSWSPIPRVGNAGRDPGGAMFAVIDATSILGRPIVVWGLDFPSDLRRWRYGLMRDGAARLSALRQPVATGDPPHPVFPAPDIIAGDFNTPRGSASLGLIAPGFTHAFRQGGFGYAASWPRRSPLVHIDHVFVGPSLRAVRYRVIDPGIAEHLVQTADITARAPRR
jgi:hypothetical protein